MPKTIDYRSWLKDFRPILAGFKNKRIFLLFSGGQDSSLALDFLQRAKNEFSYDLEIHCGNYPIHRYDRSIIKKIGCYWQKRGAAISWHDIASSDKLLIKSKVPCLACQKLRRTQLKKTLFGQGQDWPKLVLAVCYNLWDITSYSIEHLALNVFSDRIDPDRFFETAQRFYPVLKMKGGYTVFRPLIKYNGSDIKSAVKKLGLPYMSKPCRYASFRPKRILSKYYESAGLHFDYDRVVKFMEKNFRPPKRSDYSRLKKEKYLNDVF